MNTFLAILPYLLVFGGLIGSGIYAWRKCKREPQYVELVCYKNNSFVVSEETLDFLDSLDEGDFLYKPPTSKYRSMLKQEILKAAVDTPKSKKKTYFFATVTVRDKKILVHIQKLDSLKSLPR